MNFSCSSITKENLEDTLQKFNTLTKIEKAEYYNSLNKEQKFFILERYLPEKCFTTPIHNAIKFKKDGNLCIDWMISGQNGLGLVYASGKEKPFKEYTPLKWKITNNSLVIKKGEQYLDYVKIKGEDDLILDFEKKNEIVFDKVFFTFSENYLEIIIKNKKQQVALFLSSCEQWPVMDSE